MTGYRSAAELVAVSFLLAGCGGTASDETVDGSPIAIGGQEPTAVPGSRSAGCGTPPPVIAGETSVRLLRAGELDRDYRLHLPVGYSPDVATPVVLSFHGYTGSAASSELEVTGLSEHADEHGYVVVYPQSTSFSAGDDRITSWNDLSCNGPPGLEGPICAQDAVEYTCPPECGDCGDCGWCSCHDDLAFVDALLDELEASLCVDLDRIYATGFSNGAMFVQRLGCERAERFAAVAPVHGTLARGFPCAPDAPVAIMEIAGRNDRAVPADGSRSVDGYYYTPVAEVIDAWAGAASQDCDAVAVPYETPEAGAQELRCFERADCKSDVEVVSCSWDGEHVWPRSEEHGAFGNRLLWQFFRRNAAGT